MPLWKHQMEFMKTNLTNFRPIAGDDDVVHQSHDDGTAHIINHCYTSDEYWKIRITYYDAGDKCQVLNSLWYPHASYDLPVMGIDLLVFNRRSVAGGIRVKYLSVIEFQPIRKTGVDNSFLGVLREIAQCRAAFMIIPDTSLHWSFMAGAKAKTLFLLCCFVLSAVRYKVTWHFWGTPLRMIGRRTVLNAQAGYDKCSYVHDSAKAVFEKVFGEEWFDIGDELEVEKALMKSY